MEWIESMLSTMVSLRVFRLDLDIFESPAEDCLSLIMKTSTHLQYFTVHYEDEPHCWKQLRGEWIVCDETECP
jgi:hypothetical protein